jgi:dipeptidyl aminopeptidase/acylaminoacyl peptidase
MRVWSHALAAALAGATLLVLAPAAQAQSPPPVEAYGRLPAVGGVSISPDGQRLAVAVSQGDATAFQVINLGTSQTEANYGVPAALSLRGVNWADSGHALLIVSRAVQVGYGRRGEAGQAIAFTLANRRQRDLEVSGGLVPAPGETGIVHAFGRDSSGRFSVYRVNLETGDARRVESGVQDTADVIISAQGQLIARIDQDTQRDRWKLYFYDGGQAREIMEDASEFDSPTLSLAGVLADGRIVAVGRRSSDDHDRMLAISSAGEVEVIAQDARYDMESAILEPRTNTVVGVHWIEDLPRQRFFDPGLELAAERARAYFRNGYAELVNWSQDRQRFVVFAENGRDAGAYYLFDLQANSMRSIGRRYPELTTPAALGDRQSITYPARDGTRISAYLTAPEGAGRNLPLVLLPHGGPHARDQFAFDWWAAFLASRGYAVLQPNYRGSTGYGYAWFNSGRRQWGDGLMQTDIEDGVDALIRSGIADRNRVCIVGASYGGYAALAGATITPDRYRCAVAVAGVSDLPKMLDDTAMTTGPNSSASEWWRLSIGDRVRDRDHLRSVSPANLAQNARAPILLIHGNNDSVVPFLQSREMLDALRAAGKDVRMVTLDRDDHWLSNAQTRIQMLREVETFLAQYLQPGRISVDDTGAPAANSTQH